MKPYLLAVAPLVVLWLIPLAAQAQVQTDGTVGAATTLGGPDFSIPEDLGTRVGNNLFHSFSIFRIGDAQSATFTGAASIDNVIARVTGGSTSQIDGALRSAIASANLYLVNPAGVTFGPNASVNVDGALHVGGVDAVRFSDGGSYFADPGAASSLSVATPEAFGFTGAGSGAVVVDRSVLGVGQGRQISLVGSSVEIRGTPAGGFVDAANVAAPGGRVLVAAAASPGDVPLATPGAPELDAITAQSQVTLTDAARLDASSAAGNGEIFIIGGQVRVESSQVTSNTLGAAAGAPVAVMVAGSERVDVTGAAISADTFGSSDAGAVLVDAGDLRMSGAAQLSSATFGSGESGTVAVRASGLVSLAGAASGGNPTAIVTNSFGTGHARLVSVAAARVNLSGGAQIGSGAFAVGNSGGVQVRASEAIELQGSEPAGCPLFNGCSTVIDANAFGAFPGAGAAGAIVVEAPRVTLLDGGTISSTTVGTGQGGSVTVRASDTLTLSGAAVPSVGLGAAFFAVSPSAIVAVTTGTGNAGTIEIVAGNVDLIGGGAISSTSLGGGQGGSISLTASDTVRVSGSADAGTPESVSPSTIGASALNLVGASANAGELVLTMPRLIITDGARVDTLSRGSGQGGNIRIESSDRVVISDSSLTTQAFSNGAGGNITLNTVNLLHLVNAEISTSVAGGVGAGGNINIDPQFVVLAGSRIQANAFGGAGGNISIVAGSFFADPGSSIEASSTLGIEGNIQIDSPDTTVSDNLLALPVAYQDAGDLLGTACGARSGADGSSLTIAGRGGQPQHPDAFLVSQGLPARWGTQFELDHSLSQTSAMPYGRQQSSLISMNCP